MNWRHHLKKRHRTLVIRYQYEEISQDGYRDWVRVFDERMVPISVVKETDQGFGVDGPSNHLIAVRTEIDQVVDDMITSIRRSEFRFPTELRIGPDDE